MIPDRLLTLLCSLLLFAGCKQSSRHGNVTAASSPGQEAQHNAAIVACSLVTMGEVAAIQGATIIDARDSVTPSGNLTISQCYYSSKEANLAVSLAVIQPSKQSSFGTEAREYWTDNFEHFEEHSNRNKEEPDKEGKGSNEQERQIPPTKMDGIGEQAYWSGNRVGGALYVLKNGLILRVSVGGPGDEVTKMTKSKAIAKKAIRRL